MAGRTHGSQIVPTSTSVAIGIAGQAKMVYSVTLISGATAGVLSLKNGSTSGGTLYLSGTGTINQGVTFNYSEGFFFPGGCFAATDSNTTSILVSYEEFA